MSAIAEPPVQQSDFMTSATASFVEEMAKANQTEPPEVTPEVKKVDPPKPVENKSGVPDSLLSGKKVGPVTPEPSEDDKLLSEEPKGKMGHDQFKKLQAIANAKIAAAHAEREKALKEFEEFKKTGVAPADYEPTKKERDEYKKQLEEHQKELERVAVERSPKFQAKFVAGEKALREQAESALEEVGGDKKIVGELLSARGKRRFELLDGLEIPDSARSYLTTVLASHDALQSEKASVLAQSSEQAKAWGAEQQREQEAREAQQRQQEDEVFSRVGSTVAKTFEPFMEIEGETEWNAGVADRRAEAKRFFNGDMKLDDLAEIAYYGLGAKVMHKMFHTMRERNETLQARVKELEAASPDPAHSREQARTSDELMAKMSPEERRRHTFNEEMAAVRNQG